MVFWGHVRIHQKIFSMEVHLPTTSYNVTYAPLLCLWNKHVTCHSGDGPMFSTKLQTNRSNMLHRTKKRPLWTEHGTQWIALSAESCRTSNETLPNTLEWLGATWRSRTNQRSTLSKVNAERHEIIHLPATPKSYKGDPFALCQGRYYVANHKVHIVLQNEAWLGRVETLTFSYNPWQTCSNPRITWNIMKQNMSWKHQAIYGPRRKTLALEQRWEALEVLPQVAQSQNLQALIARMACVRPCAWLALDLPPVLIQSPWKGCPLI